MEEIEEATEVTAAAVVIEVGAVPEEAEIIRIRRVRQRLLLQLLQEVRGGVPDTPPTPPTSAVTTIIALATKVGTVSLPTRARGRIRSPRGRNLKISEILTSTATKINTNSSLTQCIIIHTTVLGKYTRKLLKLTKKKNQCCPLLLSGVQSKR